MTNLGRRLGLIAGILGLWVVFLMWKGLSVAEGGSLYIVLFLFFGGLAVATAWLKSLFTSGTAGGHATEPNRSPVGTSAQHISTTEDHDGSQLSCQDEQFWQGYKWREERDRELREEREQEQREYEERVSEAQEEKRQEIYEQECEIAQQREQEKWDAYAEREQAKWEAYDEREQAKWEAYDEHQRQKYYGDDDE